MKVLVILSNDVYNFPTVNIVKEMLKRGYQLEFYSMRMESQHIRMFNELNIEVKDFNDIEPDMADKYDFIYSASTISALPMEWWRVKKYIFHFTTTAYDEPGGYGDYTFTQRDMHLTLIKDEQTIEQIKAFLATPGMVSGNPKYEVEDESSLENRKQILYVDASHSPDGIIGRMAEARMVLEVANKFPDYKVIIKPRYLKSDTSIVHANRVFLYDCIKSIAGDDIPENLQIIKEHVDLEEIARRSEIIITSGNTSSYCSIGAYEKKGLIAGELPMIYPKWEYHSKLFRQISYRSGLMVPYYEVVDALPKAKYFNKENLVEMGLDIHDASKRIVNEIERIFNDYIKKNCYPPIMALEEKINLDDVIFLRFCKSLFLRIDYLKRDIPDSDFQEADNFVFELIKNRDWSVVTNFDNYLNAVEKIIRKLIINNYHYENASFIEQEHYILAMMRNGRMEEIIGKNFDAEEMYFYVLGRYQISEKQDFQAAANSFEHFTQLVFGATYEQSYAYLLQYKESAFYWLGYCYYKMVDYEKALRYFMMCEELTNNSHKKAWEYIQKIYLKIESESRN